MHQILPVAPPAQPVTLRSDLGQVWRYASLRAVIDALGVDWLSAYVGAHHIHTRPLSDGEQHTYPYILRGSFGEIITAEDCRRLADPDRVPWWARARPALLSWNGAGPVPYVHRRRHGHCFRRVATLGEHRAAAAVLRDEGEPVFRGARNGHNLPTAYDDRHISSHRIRNWKAFRRTRWKAT
jgi:hypothetical protein